MYPNRSNFQLLPTCTRSADKRVRNCLQLYPVLNHNRLVSSRPLRCEFARLHHRVVTSPVADFYSFAKPLIQAASASQ